MHKQSFPFCAKVTGKRKDDASAHREDNTERILRHNKATRFTLSGSLSVVLYTTQKVFGNTAGDVGEHSFPRHGDSPCDADN